KKTHRAILRVCNIQRVGRRHMRNSLWLPKTRQRADCFALFDVDDTQTVVTQLSDVQPFPAQIHREMIDPPEYVPERDLRLELQSLCFSMLAAQNQPGDNPGRDRARLPHPNATPPQHRLTQTRFATASQLMFAKKASMYLGAAAP